MNFGFGFGFGIITSFGFGPNFGSKSNQKPKLFIYYNHCLTNLHNCIEKFKKKFHPRLFSQIKPFLIMSRSLNLGADATFDWTLFANSNRRKVVRRPSKVVMFDSDYVPQKIDNYRT
jgi:hypothetical protein